MNAEWKRFLDAAPWFLKPGQPATVEATRPPGSWGPRSPAFSKLFPVLTECLNRAAVTPVAVAQVPYVLLTWDRGQDGPCGWLSPAPSAAPSPRLHEDHRVLLGSFGGIVARSNEPEESWLRNHDAVLTESEAERDASFLADYAWAFEEAGAAIPTELARFYSIAREANGNTTFCDRSSGEIVLFAPDHGFDHVTPYPGCPEYTLYRINGAASFREWVDAVAGQCLAAVR